MAAGRAGLPSVSDERSQCMPARPGLPPCPRGFGTAKHTVSVLLFLHASPIGASEWRSSFHSGDEHGALPGRQNSTRPMGHGLQPSKDSWRCSITKNAGWQLPSNFGLFIIIIPVRVNRLLDGRKLNMTWWLAYRGPRMPMPHLISLDKTN
jgi:hypothetical protein